MEGFLSCSVIEYRCIKEGRRGPREQRLRFWWLSIAEPTSCHSTVLANTSVIITGTVTTVWMWKLRLRKVRQLMCYHTAQTSELNTVASNCTDLQRSPEKSIIAPTEHKPPNTSVFLKVLSSRSHYVDSLPWPTSTVVQNEVIGSEEESHEMNPYFHFGLTLLGMSPLRVLPGRLRVFDESPKLSLK